MIPETPTPPTPAPPPEPPAPPPSVGPDDSGILTFDDDRHPWSYRSAAEWERRDEMVPMWTPEDEDNLRRRVFKDPS